MTFQETHLDIQVVNNWKIILLSAAKYMANKGQWNQFADGNSVAFAYHFVKLYNYMYVIKNTINAPYSLPVMARFGVSRGIILGMASANERLRYIVNQLSLADPIHGMIPVSCYGFTVWYISLLWFKLIYISKRDPRSQCVPSIGHMPCSIH